MSGQDDVQSSLTKTSSLQQLKLVFFEALTRATPGPSQHFVLCCHRLVHSAAYSKSSNITESWACTSINKLSPPPAGSSCVILSFTDSLQCCEPANGLAPPPSLSCYVCPPRPSCSVSLIQFVSRLRAKHKMDPMTDTDENCFKCFLEDDITKSEQNPSTLNLLY
ncbi:hypothetical protein Q5P01_020551 [Channa striata]|uniref:Uncharacterized protein n=1 Tax=Channa striata TaxID=64152 RepID=A0AA88LXX6_CHASR|nr:hypothetical protein Q5P01_020551 [Channa striata]